MTAELFNVFSICISELGLLFISVSYLIERIRYGRQWHVIYMNEWQWYVTNERYICVYIQFYSKWPSDYSVWWAWEVLPLKLLSHLPGVNELMGVSCDLYSTGWYCCILICHNAYRWIFHRDSIKRIRLTLSMRQRKNFKTKEWWLMMPTRKHINMWFQN